MAIVLGDHRQIDENTTRQVILVDMIPNGATLRIVQPNNENLNSLIYLPPSSGPIRYELDIPKIYNYISLETPDGVLIATRIDHRDGLSLVLIYSCDHVEADIENSLWQSLSMEYENSINEENFLSGRILHLHIGDNIYADHAWNESQNEPHNALEKYRRRYRKTWFGSYNRRLTYKSGSHLMVEDDHFVVNNYVFSERDENEISDAALQCYLDYQNSLHFGDHELSINNGWVRSFGKDVIITFERFTEPINIENVIETIRNVKNYHNPTGLIIATGWPCIPSPRNTFLADIYRTVLGTDKFLTDQELYQLYRALFDLNVDHIVLVGGDLHFGFIGRIVDEMSLRYIDLIIASPISNHPSITRKMAASGYPDRIDMGNSIYVIPFLVLGTRNYLKLMIADNHITRYHPTLILADQWVPENIRSFITSLNRMR